MARFKIAVAGCGGMSHSWIEYALTREDAEIVALVDLYEETAKKTAKKYELNCPTYTDITAAINETGANLVFDVTIPASHKDITVTALSLGCDVFGEKPMGVSMEEATAMLASREGIRKKLYSHAKSTI